jgi:hypothetical protein
MAGHVGRAVGAVKAPGTTADPLPSFQRKLESRFFLRRAAKAKRFQLSLE